MAELARTPEASARVLAASFPGPTAWSRLPVVDLPEADELGPIPAALSRLGRPAAQALAPLLDSADPDTRYFALLTAGNLAYVELVDGVLRGLFDLEPDISSAARVAASALKHLPRFDAAMRDLRQELTNRDPLRRSLAARALGSLHDRDAIEGLINLTGSDDEMCAQAAAEALREITRATLGLQPRQWTAWWAENRTRRRADWLVAALRHKELDVRLAAIEELSRALNDTLGYYADAPESEREAAVRRWEAAAVDPGAGPEARRALSHARDLRLPAQGSTPGSRGTGSAARVLRVPPRVRVPGRAGAGSPPPAGRRRGSCSRTSRPPSPGRSSRPPSAGRRRTSATSRRCTTWAISSSSTHCTAWRPRCCCARTC